MPANANVLRYFVAGLFSTFLFAHSAQAGAESFVNDQARLDLEWGELMHGRGVPVLLRPEAPVEFEVLPERVSRLDQELQADPELARMAIKRALDKPARYDQGIYGKLGTSTVYVAPARRVKSKTRLYWTMVRVLSEKYGCFIVNKNRDGESFRFQCRDGRHVLMNRKSSGGEYAFWGRQFHANGQEVIVKPAQTGRRAFARMMQQRRDKY
ncbi:MAG: hypothetical protein RIQ81_1372 [Pseudomonadota bacterium]|jgi:hypothetical protein